MAMVEADQKHAICLSFISDQGHHTDTGLYELHRVLNVFGKSNSLGTRLKERLFEEAII